jgi:hypothetical protein
MKVKTRWTRFMDMHSGGPTKEPPYEFIYIEAPQDEAEVIFYNRFGHSPNRVSCTCCGDDYFIQESDSLEQATGYDRGCASGYVNAVGKEVPEKEAWVNGKGVKKGYTFKLFERQKYKYLSYQTLKEYLKHKNVLVIRRKDIKPEERVGTLPQQGYVWMD